MNIIEIGIGPHAKRVYVPAIIKLSQTYNIELSLAIDLKEKEEDVKSYFSSVSIAPQLLFVDPFDGDLPQDLKKALNDFVKVNQIQAVIISTEPRSHYVYAKWALDQGLNILMDKPISTRENVVTDIDAALGIREEYNDLLKKYVSLQKRKQTAFTINAQRRYHDGFELVSSLLKEIASKTNCPVTSIQSMHCDGQWRLPSEIVTQKYHPYGEGYGKASHSGYHIFDIAYTFYKSSLITGKLADSAEVYSSFIQPNGFLFQLSEADYARYFGEEYKKVKLYSDKQLKKKYQGFGEMDAFSNIRFLKQGENVCNISINLLHNGFARRTWIKPGSDLYKGNGRVKHEYHNIQQGPFQNIQIHSYQSNDKHETSTEQDYEIGGNNHFDIYVFRNFEMTGDDKPLKIIRMSDLSKKNNYDKSKLVVELTKESVVKEFFDFIYGKIGKDKLRSNIDDHEIPVNIMSSVYSSHVNQQAKKDPVARFKLNI